MAYRSCNMLEAFFINFNGAIDIPEKECITFCCEPVEGRPGVAFGESAAETW